MSNVGRWAIVLLALSLGLNAGLLIGRGTRPNDAGPRQGPPGDGARGGPPGMEGMMDRHLERLSQGLGLDDSQQQKLQTVYDDLFPRVLERHRAIRSAREEIGKRYSAAELDTRGLARLLDRLSRSQTELDSLVALIMLREAEILTVEQRRRYVVRMPWSGRGGPPSGPPDGRRGPPRRGGPRGGPGGGPPDGPPPGGP